MYKVKITIGNSYSRVEGLTSLQFTDIKKLLSYTPDPQAVYFSGGFLRPRYLIDSKGYFPTGLLSTVKEYLKTTHFVVIDGRSKPMPSEDIFTLKLGD